MDRIAVLIPCYNEETTVFKVVSDFKKYLPEADVYVFDNDSSDRTVEKALEAGAIVRKVPYRGKGNVVRWMFREVKADIYVLVDGDDTYPAEEVSKLIRPVMDREANMVVGKRIATDSRSFRRFHVLGNKLITKTINLLFGSNLGDVLSGYRVFDKLFVKGIQLSSKGFEIETEMTLRALEANLKIIEIPVTYKSRPEGSYSKLRTFQDGLLIALTIIRIFKEYKPMFFFSLLSLFLLLLGLLVGIPVIAEFMKFHYVYKVPSAVLAASLIILSFLSLCCGVILDSFKEFRKSAQEYWIKNAQNG